MELPDDLCVWVEEATSGRVAEARRVMGGASREAWMVDVAADDGALHELFLRRDNGTGPMQGTPYTIGRVASVYRVVANTSVPVPAVVAAHPDGNTVLLERIEGEAYFPAAGDARAARRAVRRHPRRAAHHRRAHPRCGRAGHALHAAGARHARARHLGAAAARARPRRSRR